MSGPFVGGMAHNMAAAAQHEDFVATTAIAGIVVRILVPMAGRFVWHWWNKVIGEVQEYRDAEEVIVTTELLALLGKQQQSPQPPSPATPNNSGKRNRITPLYSKEPDPKGNLFEDFEQATKRGTTEAIGSTTTYQFGPIARVVTNDDYSNAIQLLHDTNKTKLFSVRTAKDGDLGQTNGDRPQTW